MNRREWRAGGRGAAFALVLAPLAVVGAARAADRDFGYGVGTGAYAPGSSTGYGIGAGAYAPQAQGGMVTPRYGAPGSANSGFRAPSAPGAPVPGAGAGATPGMVPGGSQPAGALAPGSAMPGAAMPGRPGMAGPGYGAVPGAASGTVQGLSGGAGMVPASPFALAPIDTGILPRRAPRGAPASGPFGAPSAVGPGGLPAPDSAMPADPFRR